MELKHDREVVIEAVTQLGRVLWFASEERKRDRAVVMEAVRQSDCCIVCLLCVLLLLQTPAFS